MAIENSVLTSELTFVRDDGAGLVYYGVDLGGVMLRLGAVKTGKYDKWAKLADEQAEAAKSSGKK
jgi:hypothetical protein